MVSSLEKALNDIKVDNENVKASALQFLHQFKGNPAKDSFRLAGEANNFPPEAVRLLEKLQRVGNVVSDQYDIARLIEAKLYSAAQIASLTPKRLAEKTGLSLEAATATHNNAAAVQGRNEMLLAAILGNKETSPFAQEELPLPAKLSNLIDESAVVDGRPTVTSPAAYLVDLLEFLPDHARDRLFERRSDLGDLELSVANSDTTLPYIDLVNEVLESFYCSSVVPALNIRGGEDAEDLMTEPHNVLPDAYHMLRNEVWPVGSLPFERDAQQTRLFLSHMGLSRERFLRVLGPLRATPADLKVTRSAITLDVLALPPAEFAAITGEDPQKLGDASLLRRPHEYWGYDSQMAMDAHSNSDDKYRGVSYVHQSLLPRLSITLQDLQELLDTNFINPLLAHHKPALVEKLMDSYPRLAGSIDHKKPRGSSDRLQPVSEALVGLDFDTDEKKWVLENVEDVGKALVISSPNRYFSVSGKLMFTPKSGEAVSLGTLTQEGVFVESQSAFPRFRIYVDVKGRLRQLPKSGSRSESDPVIHKSINIDLPLPPPPPARSGLPLPLPAHSITGEFKVYLQDVGMVATFTDEGARIEGEYNMNMASGIASESQKAILKGSKFGVWFDGLNADDQHTSSTNMRICRLDGMPLEADVWDRINRFVRLKKRLNWTIPETDAAIRAITSILPKPAGGSAPSISPEVLDNLADIVLVQKEIPLKIDDLLSFWSDISAGLYGRLFMRKTILRRCPDFSRLSSRGEIDLIPTHIPAICSALGINVNDFFIVSGINRTKKEEKLPKLSVSFISSLYRQVSFSRALRIPIKDIETFRTHVGDPFLSPSKTFTVLQLWTALSAAGISLRHLDDALKAPPPFLDLVHDSPPPSHVVAAASLLKSLQDIRAKTAGDEKLETLAPRLFDAEAIREIKKALEKKPSAEDAANLAKGPLISLCTFDNALEKALLQDKASDRELSITTALKSFLEVVQFEKAVNSSMESLLSDVRPGTLKYFSHLCNVSSVILKELSPPVSKPTKGEVDTDPAEPADDKVTTDPAEPTIKEERKIGSTNSTKDQVKLSNVGAKSDPPEKIEGTVEPGQEQKAEEEVAIGYLIPPTTDRYFFNSNVEIQGMAMGADNSVSLVGGLVYHTTLSLKTEWRTQQSLWTGIFSSFVRSSAVRAVSDSVRDVRRAAAIPDALSLTPDEIDFIQRSDGFKSMKLLSPSLDNVVRLVRFWRLRKIFRGSPINFMKVECTTPSKNNAAAASQLAKFSKWDEVSLGFMLDKMYKETPDFSNEQALADIQDAMDLCVSLGAGKESVAKVFEWSNPERSLGDESAMVSEVTMFARAKTGDSDSRWAQVAAPLFDNIRRSSRDALVAALLKHPKIREWNISDADGLFEYFLIDVSMGTCMETSRIKQAISSVQIFVQRCLLNREKAISPADISARRWEWMQKYTLWEANRRVFLYPENWLEPTLRDGQTDFFKTLTTATATSTFSPDKCLLDYLHSWIDVSMLEPVAICQGAGECHFFARTPSAPYKFYHRALSDSTRAWSPWQALPFDIPTLDVNSLPSVTAKPRAGRRSGTYLIPFRDNSRLLLFMPQLQSKNTNEKNAKGEKLFTWEIKMGVSEFRNGKWLPKSTSASSLVTSADAIEKHLDMLTRFRFAVTKTSTSKSGNAFTVDIANVTKIFQDIPTQALWLQMPGTFAFEDGAFTALPKAPDWLKRVNFTDESFEHKFTDFQHFMMGNHDGMDCNGEVLCTLPKLEPVKTAPEGTFPMVWNLTADKTKAGINRSYFAISPISTIKNISATLLSNWVAMNNFFAADMMLLDMGAFPMLFSNVKSRLVWGDDFGPGEVGKVSKFDVSDVDQALGRWSRDVTGGGAYHELRTPPALYNWELFVHAPMLLACRLLQYQRFEDAIKTLQFVFDPTHPENAWRWIPFQRSVGAQTLESVLSSIGGQENTEEWSDKPFSPYGIARQRPLAYMRWFVTKYVEVLVAQGDHYFRMNSLEALPFAIQSYTQASHVLGADDRVLAPKKANTALQTYNTETEDWDKTTIATVELESIFPYRRNGTKDSSHLVGLFGSIRAPYFTFPSNPVFASLRSLVDDRLYKLRHCQDIDGNPRRLSLYEPSIDPGALVQAEADGMSIGSIVNDLNQPMPNYRMVYLLNKAIELCSELRGLGSSYLAFEDRMESENLALLRQSQETAVYSLLLDVKQKELEEANQSLETLKASRTALKSRMTYFLRLLGEEPADCIPGESEDFNELQIQMLTPDKKGLRLNDIEKSEIAFSAASQVTGFVSSAVESSASFAAMIPDMFEVAAPAGLGVEAKYGGTHFSAGLRGLAGAIKTAAEIESAVANDLARFNDLQYRVQDRLFQANSTGHEIKSTDSQIAAQNRRIEMIEKDIEVQQQTIDNTAATEEYLRTKYTNAELASWLRDRTLSLYQQAYAAASEMAQRAENAFKFERGLVKTSFIKNGYWNSTRNGLLAGEQLHADLRRLEEAYMNSRGYDFEIVRPVSLRAIDPVALLNLRGSGEADFTLDERLFDMDFPGHFNRRIKSVSVTIPCSISPFSSVSCTLTLLEHCYRISQEMSPEGNYGKQADDPRFHTDRIPINAIALSSAQNDSGVFELSFRDERYIPFEGAGLISKWRLKLPEEFRQFDYASISDVILNVRYTSVLGNEDMKTKALDPVKDTADPWNQKFYYDVAAESAGEWMMFSRSSKSTQTRTMTLRNVLNRLPFYKRSVTEKPQAITVTLVGPKKAAEDMKEITLKSGPDDKEGVKFDNVEEDQTSKLAMEEKAFANEIGDWILSRDGGDALDWIGLVVEYSVS